jgi:general secretion pathway protein G
LTNVFSGGRSGLTLVELIMTLSILSILSALILPSAQLMSKRNKEIELRRNLRIIRNAIDDYKKSYDKAITDKQKIGSLNKSGYPETFEKLVEGDDFGGAIPDKKRFLRRVPRDPFMDKTSTTDSGWGLRSSKDKPDSDIWGGEDIYDVFSLSREKAIDGTEYKDW